MTSAGRAALLLLACSAGRAGADATHVRLEVTVVRHASVAMNAPRTLFITAADVARGYLQLDEPVEVAVRTNSRDGVLLGLALRPTVAGAVLSRIDAAEIRLAGGEARMRVAKIAPGLASRVVRLAARFELHPGTRPGPIAFPVSLSVVPD